GGERGGGAGGGSAAARAGPPAEQPAGGAARGGPAGGGGRLRQGVLPSEVRVSRRHQATACGHAPPPAARSATARLNPPCSSVATYPASAASAERFVRAANSSPTTSPEPDAAGEPDAPAHLGAAPDL